MVREPHAIHTGWAHAPPPSETLSLEVRRVIRNAALSSVPAHPPFQPLAADGLQGRHPHPHMWEW